MKWEGERRMLKTVKYELMRNRLTLLILACILGGAELIFLLAGSPGSIVLGLMLLYAGGMISYFTIWLMGLLSFSRDIREKSGYMIFLTPVSPYKIIFSKMLTGLIELAVAAIALILLAVLDMGIINARYGRELSFLRTFARMVNTTPEEVWAVVIVLLISGVFITLTVYSIAYLGSAIAATATQSKGGRRGLSIVFVILILIVYRAIADSIPELDVSVKSHFFREFLSKIPQLIFDILVATGCTLGTGYLMDKKISL